MPKVTKTFTQTNDRGELESELSITVSIDTGLRCVDEVLTVDVFNFQTLQYTDLTQIFLGPLEKQLDSILDSVNFWELYCDSRAEEEDAA